VRSRSGRCLGLAGGCLLLAGLGGCAGEASTCATCDTIVIAATGDPSQLLPPLAVETVARDIGDQVYERLADLAPARWKRVDLLAWRFPPAASFGQTGRP
jgi:hypothetical protein